MGLYESYEADLQSDVEFGGVPLTILSDLHPRMRKVSARLQKKYQHNLGGEVSERITEEIELEKVAVAVAGFPKPELVTGRDGKPLPFSRENVIKLMTDLPWLRKDVLYAVLVKESFRKEARAALGESSAPSSELT